MTIYIGLLAVALVIGGGAIVAFRYNPVRKSIFRALDPSWKRRAANPVFAPDEERAEEQNLFVSSTVMRDGCDIIWAEEDAAPPATLAGPVRDGTVVHVNAKHVERFIDEVLPALQGRIVLVSGCDTVSTRNYDIDRVRGSGKVLQWFMQNVEQEESQLEDGFVVPLPLGVNFHKLDPESNNQSRDMGLPASPGTQQLILKMIRDELPPPASRPLRVYANFHLNMDTFLRDRQSHKRRRARQEALDVLKDKPFTLLEPRQAPRNVVWRRYGQAAFEASPHGNGLDCHRTWEALLLKTIPIVKTSTLDPLYEGLPVAIVDDWNEVSPERLRAWVERFAPWFDQPLPDKLYSNHWIARFHAFA